MSRGPTIRQEEVDEAHKMKADGAKLDVIALTLKRSMPTVRKMLRMPPSGNKG